MFRHAAVIFTNWVTKIHEHLKFDVQFDGEPSHSSNSINSVSVLHAKPLRSITHPCPRRSQGRYATPFTFYSTTVPEHHKQFSMCYVPRIHTDWAGPHTHTQKMNTARSPDRPQKLAYVRKTHICSETALACGPAVYPCLFYILSKFMRKDHRVPGAGAASLNTHQPVHAS